MHKRRVIRTWAGCVVLAGLLMGWTPSGIGQGAEPDLLKVAPAQTLTVMSYNVENFFDVFDNPYTSDEETPVKRRDQVEAIAKAIAAGSPDVVLFQEIENEHVLAQMAADFLPGYGFRYIARNLTNSGRGIDLAVMSRYPIRRLASYRLREFRHPDDGPGVVRGFSRDAMHITIDVGHDKPVHLLNVHLKSNSSRPGDPFSMKQRTAEAMELKRIAQELLEDDPDAWVVVAGDFNSDYEKRRADDRNWPATAHLLARAADGTQTLTDPHAGLPRSRRITLPSKGSFPPAVFDFVLASPDLAKRIKPGSAKVLINPALTSGADHRPVYVTFELSK